MGVFVERVSHLKRFFFSRKGLIVLVLFLLGIFLIFSVVALWQVRQERQAQKKLRETRREIDGQKQDNVSVQWPDLWGPPGQNCQNFPSVTFTASPISIKDIEFVEPMGELKEGHIVPGDHIGINYKTSPTSTPVKVYAPADGLLVRVERHPYTPPPGYPQNMRHYHMYLIHSCTLFTGFVHLTDFAPDILAKSNDLKALHEANLSTQKSISVAIPVKAGQELGTAWSFALLGMVTVDLNIMNKGYLKPESYRGENWRIHSVSPFEYFSQPLKTQLFKKNPRTAEPRGGKIDFDIERKLVGNWFLERSGGFRDITNQPEQCGNFPCPYWDGHIAFVYDYIDPSQLRVSIGYQSGLSAKTPYGVKGNGPDFKEIGPEAGLVKYEFVGRKDISKERGYISEDPLIEVSDETRLLGTMLVQVVDRDTIKVEVFPGKTKEQVTSFSPGARIYHR